MPRHPRISGPIVALEGPSGVGKTTVARGLASAVGGVVISEAFDRMSPEPSLEPTSRAGLLRLELRLLSEERERYREAIRFAKTGRPVILDTGFFGPYTYAEGLAGLRREWDVRRGLLERLESEWGRPGRTLPALTVYLTASGTDRRRRARIDPGRHPARLVDRHARVATFERRFWKEAQRHLPRGRVLFVSAEGPVDRVVARLRSRIEAASRTRARVAETRRFLALLRRRARAIVKKGGPSRRPPR